MNKNQLDELRGLLEKELKEIKSTHDEHRNSLPSRQDRTDVQSGDWAQGLQEEEVEEQVILNEEFYLEKINTALARIKSGTYGKCEWCGIDIPLERLYAKPSVSLCLKCQEEKDSL